MFNVKGSMRSLCILSVALMGAAQGEALPHPVGAESDSESKSTSSSNGTSERSSKPLASNTAESQATASPQAHDSITLGEPVRIMNQYFDSSVPPVSGNGEYLFYCRGSRNIWGNNLDDMIAPYESKTTKVIAVRYQVSTKTIIPILAATDGEYSDSTCNGYGTVNNIANQASRDGKAFIFTAYDKAGNEDVLLWREGQGTKVILNDSTSRADNRIGGLSSLMLSADGTKVMAQVRGEYWSTHSRSEPYVYWTEREGWREIKICEGAKNVKYCNDDIIRGVLRTDATLSRATLFVDKSENVPGATNNSIIATFNIDSTSSFRTLKDLPYSNPSKYGATPDLNWILPRLSKARGPLTMINTTTGEERKFKWENGNGEYGNVMLSGDGKYALTESPSGYLSGSGFIENVATGQSVQFNKSSSGSTGSTYYRMTYDEKGNPKRIWFGSNNIEYTKDDHSPALAYLFYRDVKVENYEHAVANDPTSVKSEPPTALPENIQPCTATSEPTVGTAADPVNTLTGELNLSATDVNVPSKGIPAYFTRTFKGGYKGKLMPDWVTTYDSGIALEENNNIPEENRFQRMRAILPTTESVSFHRTGFNSPWAPDEGVRATLSDSGDTWLITTYSGVIYAYSKDKGLLLSATAPNGDKVTYTNNGAKYTGMVLGDGRVVKMDMSYSRLKITRPDGRAVIYDNSGSNLVVTVPESGSFTYEVKNGRIERISNKNKETVLRNEYDSSTGRIKKQIDALGNYRTFTWDGASRVAGVVDEKGNVSKHYYDLQGRLTNRVTPSGGVESWSWGDDGNLSSYKNAAGVSTTFSYDSQGRMTERQDASGNTTMAYNGENRLSKLTTPYDTLDYAYDTRGRRVRATHRDGTYESWVYEGDSLNPSEYYDRNRQTTKFGYTPEGFLSQLKDAGGVSQELIYDSMGKPLTEYLPSAFIPGADKEAHRLSYTYDERGRATSITPSNGLAKTVFEYSATNDSPSPSAVKKVEQGTGVVLSSESLTYSPNGLVLSRTNSQGGESKLTYDFDGLPLTEKSPRGGVTTWERDAMGNVVKRIEPSGATTTYAYNEANQIISSVSPAGNMESVDREKYRTSYEHDALGRISAMVEPGGSRTEYQYNARGEISQVKDARGGITKYTYTPEGHVASTTAPDGSTTTWEYDSMGQLTKRINPLGGVRSWSYNGAGKATGVATEIGAKTTYSYDAAGRPLEERGPGSNGSQPGDVNDTVRYSYGANDKVSSISYPGDTSLNKHYTWTPLGNVKSVSTADGATQRYNYGSGGVLSSITAPGGGTYSYERDVEGNLTKFSDAAGVSETLEYNLSGQPTRIARSKGEATDVFSMQYNAAGQNTSVLSPDGRTQRFAYGVDGSLSSREVLAPSGESLWKQELTYDAGHLPTKISSTVGNSQVNSYDSRGRLIQACIGETGDICSTGKRFDYTYDVLSDKTTETRRENGALAISTQWGYDNGGRLLSSQLNGEAPVEFKYNSAGDLLGSGDPSKLSLSYNAKHEPTTYTMGGVKGFYGYDIDGNRSSSAFNGEERVDQYDPSGELGILRYSTSRSNEGNVMASEVKDLYATPMGNMGEYDTVGLGKWFVDGYLGTPSGSTASPTGVSFDPYGNPLDADKQGGNTVPGISSTGFIGTGKDSSSFINMGARIYSPVLGAFTQADPLTGEVGEPATGLYTYAQGMVGSHSDASGLWPNWSIPSIPIPTIPNAPEFIADQIWNHASDSYKQMLVRASQEYKDDPLARNVNLGMATLNQLSAGIPEAVKNEYFKDSHPFGWDTESKTYALGNDIANPASYFSLDPQVNIFTKENQRASSKVVDQGVESDSLERINQMPGCFVAGTKVLTPGGEVAIEQLRVGDEVVTTDPESKAESTQRITGVVKHENIPVYVVGTPQGEVKTTGDHPFWVKGRGWVRAENLHLGNELFQPNNTSVHITSVGYNGEVTTVYNITTAKNHDFYVKAGSAWLLVHNNDCGITKDPREWTKADIEIAAKNLGLTKLPRMNSHGQSVFRSKKGEIVTYDVDGHRGGVWKVFYSEKLSINNRKGTYDKNLKERLGK